MIDKRDKFTFDIFGSQARAECLAMALKVANVRIKQRDEEIARLKLKIAALEDNSERDAKIEKTKLSIMAFGMTNEPSIVTWARSPDERHKR